MVLFWNIYRLSLLMSLAVYQSRTSEVQTSFFLPMTQYIWFIKCSSCLTFIKICFYQDDMNACILHVGLRKLAIVYFNRWANFSTYITCEDRLAFVMSYVNLIEVAWHRYWVNVRCYHGKFWSCQIFDARTIPCGTPEYMGWSTVYHFTALARTICWSGWEVKRDSMEDKLLICIKGLHAIP